MSNVDNTPIGTDTLSTIDGSYNSAIGFAAGNVPDFQTSPPVTTNGTFNTFVGAYTGFDKQEAVYMNSTAVGAYSLISDNNQIVLGGSNVDNNYKTQSVVVPYGDLSVETGSINGVCVYSDSVSSVYLGGLPDVDHNFYNSNLSSVAVGLETLTSVSGTWNNAVGFGIMAGENVLGKANNAFGCQALMNNQTGNENSSFGNNAMMSLNDGIYNNAFGSRALQNNVHGKANNAFGAGAMYYNVSGSYNNAFGFCALAGLADGSCNVAIGRLAGNYPGAKDDIALSYTDTNQIPPLNNVSYNTFVGDSTGFDSSSNQWNNSTALGAFAKVTNNNQIVLGGYNDDLKQYTEEVIVSYGDVLVESGTVQVGGIFSETNYITTVIGDGIQTKDILESNVNAMECETNTNQFPYVIQVSGNDMGGNQLNISNDRIPDIYFPDNATIHIGCLSINKSCITFPDGTKICSANGIGPVVCFLKGTEILTRHGYKAIETLEQGDTVISVGDIIDNKYIKMTPAKESRIVWTSHFKVPVLDKKSRPVCIRKNTFGLNRPYRNLYVSPDHCIFLDGRKYVAKNLLKEGAIFQDADIEEVVYYHIELESHEGVLANGVVTESYLDIGNRHVFEYQPRLKRKDSTPMHVQERRSRTGTRRPDIQRPDIQRIAENRYSNSNVREKISVRMW
jgi:hypothetical protein